MLTVLGSSKIVNEGKKIVFVESSVNILCPVLKIK